MQKRKLNMADMERLIREGQAFPVEETAGIHIICIDTENPPIVQVTGEFSLVGKMLSYAISEIIDKAVEQTGDSEGIKEFFREVVEMAIEVSGTMKEDANHE